MLVLLLRLYTQDRLGAHTHKKLDGSVPPCDGKKKNNRSVSLIKVQAEQTHVPMISTNIISCICTYSVELGGEQIETRGSDDTRAGALLLP